MAGELLAAYEAMHADLDRVPFEWRTRGLLADLCEDMGRPGEAALHRWLRQNRKHPDGFGIVHRSHPWMWWRHPPVCHMVPVALHDLMPRWAHPTRRAAEWSLLVAMVAAGWCALGENDAPAGGEEGEGNE